MPTPRPGGLPPNGFIGKVHHLEARVGGTYRMSFKVSVGTELTVAQEGIPDVIPPEACYLGWQESLIHLAKLVEPTIPD